MTSAAKIEANRGNAKKSTGPRTPAGKARTRHNAFKHGLGRYTSFDAAEDERIEELELALGGEYPDPVDADLSTLAAQAEVELLRARRAKVVLVNSAAERLVDEKKLPAAQRAASAFARKTKVLLAIERYERRAISRRNRALDALRKSQAERRRRLAIEPVGPPRPKHARVRTNKFEQSALMLDLERVLKRCANIRKRTANIRKRTFDFSWYWSSGESIRIQVSLAGDRNSLKLLFVSAAGKPIDQQFDLSRTAMRVGGVRWAVQCPETGKWVRDLYLAQGQLHFRSRHALRLTYRSNRLTPEDRRYKRCTRLMDRVGAREPRDRPPRPKYMRRQTYHRLIEDMTEVYADSLRAQLARIRRSRRHAHRTSGQPARGSAR